MTNLEKTIKILYNTIPDHYSLFADPFKILITTIISQRTRDPVTAECATHLFNVFKNSEELARADVNTVQELIKKSGFYNEKAKRIVAVAKIVSEQYNGKVPDSEALLLKLPGVGRKTTNIVLSAGFNHPAIAVDTHVHRISNRLGWVNTKSPEETEMELKKIIPRKYWIRLNGTLVNFGQTICRSVRPLCNKCPVNRYCPSRIL